MFGAFIGDIVGSKYEFNNIKTKEFPLFSQGVYFDITIHSQPYLYNIQKDGKEVKNRPDEYENMKDRMKEFLF